MNMYILKNKLKENFFIDNFLRICLFPVFYCQFVKSEYESKKRVNGAEYSQYSWIKNYKNKYLGERCFIVATGPSLTIEDLDKIKNEHCFGMNSSVLILKNTEWKPQFYGIQDENVYKKLEKAIVDTSENDMPEVFISNTIKHKFNVPNRFKVFPLHYLDHKMFHFKGFGRYNFSDDCYGTIYDGYSITFSLMQIACYMGFREIYLLGCDCNYNQKKQHFIESGHFDPKASIMGDKMICGHIEFKKFADKKGVKVVNCTRGGMLEVYPRKKLDDIL